MIEPCLTWVPWRGWREQDSSSEAFPSSQGWTSPAVKQQDTHTHITHTILYMIFSCSPHCQYITSGFTDALIQKYRSLLGIYARNIAFIYRGNCGLEMRLKSVWRVVTQHRMTSQRTAGGASVLMAFLQACDRDTR